MDELLGKKICEIYNLGEVISPLKPVTGGLLHKMWKLKTAKGTYALKVLNPEIMRRPNILNVYIESEEIAKKVSEAGIPAVVALKTKDGPVTKFNDKFAMVYPWIEGHTLADRLATPAQVGIIGSLLAKIHHLNLTLEEPETPGINKTTVEFWENLLAKVRVEQIPVSQEAEETVKELAGKMQKFREELHQLDLYMIVSHCDLDKKNVLWRDDSRPVIIDWESAGYVNPMTELMIAAQDWSDMKKDAGNINLFKAVIDGYKDGEGKVEGSAEIIFYSSIEAVLNWLEYNIRRSYEDQFEEEERQLGKREVLKTMAELKLLYKRKEQLINSFK